MKIDLETLELIEIGSDPRDCDLDDIIDDAMFEKFDGITEDVELELAYPGDEAIFDFSGEKYLATIAWTDYDNMIVAAYGNYDSIVCSADHIVALKNNVAKYNPIDVAPGDLVMTRDGNRGAVVAHDVKNRKLIISYDGWKLLSVDFDEVLFAAHHIGGGKFLESHYIAGEDVSYTEEEHADSCRIVSAAYREDNA